MIWLMLLLLLALLLVYVFIVRPILKTQPLLSPIFKTEASLWDQLQAKITGWRTKIAARLTVIAGLLVALYDQALPWITGQNWTPLTEKLPPLALPIGLVMVGTLFDWLRKITANPPQVIVQRPEGGGSPQVVAIEKPQG
jgi:hypothetical protein